MSRGGNNQQGSSSTLGAGRNSSQALVERVLGSLPEGCRRLWAEHREAFESAPGSSHNHQAWEGGYRDHVAELFQLAEEMHRTFSSRRELPFSLQSAELVLFCHDLEKPFKYGKGLVPDELHQRALSDSEAFKRELLAAYGIELSAEEENAFTYIHGELDDYRKDERVMGPLAAFCHACDYLSARMWFDQPAREEGRLTDKITGQGADSQ